MYRFALVLAAALAGCASQPDRIVPRSTSTLNYSQYNCAALSAELQRVNDGLSELVGRQSTAASTDTALTIGGFVLWPVWLGLAATDNHRDEIARLKGEGEAVLQAIRLRCTAD